MVHKNKSKVLSIALLLLLLAGASPAEVYKVAIIKSRSFVPFDTVREKIIQKLNENKFEILPIDHDLKGDPKNGPEIVRKVKNLKPDVILTIGTLATLVIKENVKDTPIVFTMVLNPVASGITTSMGESGLNLTGVALDIPLEEQFSNFRLVAPRVRKIGVIYNPKESGLIVEEAKESARLAGLTLIPISVDSSADVPAKLELLKNSDGLWMTADSIVFTPRNTEFILLYTLKEKIPFMGISEEFVKAGALFSKVLDLDSICDQTAELIVKILHGENPARIPITTPKKIKLALNLRTAKIIGLSIPSSILKQAEVVLE